MRIEIDEEDLIRAIQRAKEYASTDEYFTEKIPKYTLEVFCMAAAINAGPSTNLDEFTPLELENYKEDVRVIIAEARAQKRLKEMRRKLCH